MKVAVFGASGRTGIPLVEQALAAGHDVVAFVRSRAKLPIQHERLTVVEGDAMNAADVEKAVQGVDAVLSVIGQAKGSPENLQTVATRNIVAAMERHGVKRFISLTGAGVPDPKDQPKLFDHVIRWALKTFQGNVLQDAINHAEVIRRSNLDWTMIRGPMLTDGPRTPSYKVGYVGVNTGPRAARANVAAFMLKEAQDRAFLKQAPAISD